MSTYDPRSIYQSYAQYGRNKKKQSANTRKTGLGSSRVGRNRGRGDSIVEGPNERANAMKDNRPLSERIDTAFVQTILDFIPNFNTDEKKEKPNVVPMEVYGRPEFTIPKSPPVSVTTLPPTGGYDEAGMNIGANFGTSMGVDYTDPRGREQRGLPQNTYQKTLGGIISGTGGRDTPVSTGSPRKPGIMAYGPRQGSTGDPEDPPVESLVNTLTTGPKKAGLGEPDNTYTIKKGDTLSEIARAYGTTVEKLVKINNLKDKSGDTILAGQKIKLIPDAPTVSEPTSATEAAETFSSAVESTYTDFVDGNEEGDKPHVGLEGAITLTGGVVADNIYYDGKKVTNNTGYTSANFDASKLDTSKATKKVGNKTIKRSDYDSDADFTKAVIEEFENVVKAGAGDDYEELSEGAKKALIKLAYNNGPDWAKYNTSKNLYKEMAKDSPDLDTVAEGILNYSTVAGGGASIGIAKARANAWNAARDEHGGAEITKITADNTGAKTKFNYYDAAGNLVHTEETSRASSKYENGDNEEIEKDTAGNW